MFPDMNPPTDNLYKFMAIAGVVILALSAYFQFETARDIRTRAWTFNREVAVAKVEEEQMKARIAAELAARGAPPAANSATQPAQAAATAPDAPDERLSAIQKKAAELNVTNDELTQAIKEVNGLVLTLWIYIATGMVIATVGFVLWYQKVQKYEDMILKAKATPADQDATKSPTAASEDPD